jgi:hypothetical protein
MKKILNQPITVEDLNIMYYYRTVQLTGAFRYE